MENPWRMRGNLAEVGVPKSRVLWLLNARSATAPMVLIGIAHEPMLLHVFCLRL